VAWLAVKAAGKNYLFPLGQSGEIFPLAGVQSVPYVRDWFRGVVNIRGGLFGVVDIAAFMADDRGEAPIVSSVLDASVVTFNSGLEVNCALLVEGLLGLRGPDDFQAHEAPPQGAPAYFGNCFKDASGVLWQEINLRALAQATQFLSISA